MNDIRICNDCKLNENETSFYNTVNMKYYCRCKDCHNKKQISYRNKHKERDSIYNKMRYAIKTNKPIESIKKDNEKELNLLLLDKVIKTIKYQIIKKEERARIDKAKAKQRNKRQSRFAQMARNIKTNDSKSIVTGFDLFKIAKKQKLICAISGRKLTKENISPDHIHPKCKGGQSVPENIQLVTRQANILKHSMNLLEVISLCQDIINYNKNKTI